MSVSVCLCVFVGPRSHLRNYMPDLHQISRAMAIGPPLAAYWYIVYFRFYWWRHICSYAKVARRRRPAAEAQCTRSLGLGYKLWAVIISVAGQQTQGTTFRALKVTFQVATPGAESAVYDWLVRFCALWIKLSANIFKRTFITVHRILS